MVRIWLGSVFSYESIWPKPNPCIDFCEEVQAAAGKNGYAKMMFGILNTQRVCVLWTAGDGVLFNNDSGSGSFNLLEMPLKKKVS